MEKYLKETKVCLHIRVRKQIQKEALVKAFDDRYKKYIISTEVGKSKELHHHILLILSNKAKVYTGTRTCPFTTWLKKEFGFKGNSDFSCVPARDQKQLSKYVVKDGSYVHKGFTDKEIKFFSTASNKKGKDEFKKELTKLEDSYYKDKTEIYQFYEAFIKLKISYGQNIYWSHCDAYVTKVMFKKDPSLICQYTSRRLGME